MTDARSPLDRFLDYLMVLAVRAVERITAWVTSIPAGTEAAA